MALAVAGMPVLRTFCPFPVRPGNIWAVAAVFTLGEGLSPVTTVLRVPHHAVQAQEGGESHAKKPKYNIEYLCLREEILSKFYANNSFQESNDPKHPALSPHALALRVGEVSVVLSHCGRRDATNKENPTPTQWMTGLEHKDMFQEEGVQLSQLPDDHEKVYSSHSLK